MLCASIAGTASGYGLLLVVAAFVALAWERDPLVTDLIAFGLSLASILLVLLMPLLEYLVVTHNDKKQKYRDYGPEGPPQSRTYAFYADHFVSGAQRQMVRYVDMERIDITRKYIFLQCYRMTYAICRDAIPMEQQTPLLDFLRSKLQKH